MEKSSFDAMNLKAAKEYFALSAVAAHCYIMIKRPGMPDFAHEQILLHYTKNLALSRSNAV